MNIGDNCYYGTKYARVKDIFKLNGRHRTVIRVFGEDEDRIVDTQYITQYSNTDLELPEEDVVEKEEKPEQDELESDASEEQSEDVSDEATEEDTTEEIEDSSKEEVASIVVADNGDEQIELGSEDNLDYSDKVKELGLDPEAIRRVLNNQQNTHKGFTFNYK